jgi:hypothetical protein
VRGQAQTLPPRDMRVGAGTGCLPHGAGAGRRSGEGVASVLCHAIEGPCWLVSGQGEHRPVHSWARRGQRAVLARPPVAADRPCPVCTTLQGAPGAVPRGPPDRGRMDRRCCTPDVCEHRPPTGSPGCQGRASRTSPVVRQQATTRLLACAVMPARCRTRSPRDRS